MVIQTTTIKNGILSLSISGLRIFLTIWQVKILFFGFKSILLVTIYHQNPNALITVFPYKKSFF